MNIVVAYKWAANPQDATVAADGTIDWSRAKAAVSEYDPVAIEMGRKLAETGGSSLVALTVGGKEADASLARKTVLARGPERLVTVTDLAGADAGRTGAILAAAVRRIGDVGAVLTGDSSVDNGASLVPSVLAGALGWPVLDQVVDVQADGDTLVVTRALDAGTQTVTVAGPAVLQVATNAASPRIPGMKDTLAAGKKPTESLAPADVDAPAVGYQVVGLAKPPARQRKRQVIDATDPQTAAKTLVSALRDAGTL